MVHVVDPNEELMWTDDHDPPMPTSEWKPGQTDRVHADGLRARVSVRRRGDDPDRAVLAAERASRAAGGRRRGAAGLQSRRALQLAPQSEAVFSVFKDGWHPAEQAEHNAMVEWHWTKKVRHARGQESEEGQRASTSSSTTPAASSTSRSRSRSASGAHDARPVHADARKPALLRKIALPAAALGTGRKRGRPHRGRQDVRARARYRRPRRTRASWAFACFTPPSSNHRARLLVQIRARVKIARTAALLAICRRWPRRPAASGAGLLRERRQPVDQGPPRQTASRSC